MLIEFGEVFAMKKGNGDGIPCDQPSDGQFVTDFFFARRKTGMSDFNRRERQ